MGFVGFVGWGMMTFSVFNEGRRVVGGGVFSSWGGRKGEKELWIYTPLSDFFWFGSVWF